MSAIPTLAEVERSHIRGVLEHTRGRVCDAARILDIDRSTLRRKLRAMLSMPDEMVRQYQETPPSITEGEG